MTFSVSLFSRVNFLNPFQWIPWIQLSQASEFEGLGPPSMLCMFLAFHWPPTNPIASEEIRPYQSIKVFFSVVSFVSCTLIQTYTKLTVRTCQENLSKENHHLPTLNFQMLSLSVCKNVAISSLHHPRFGLLFVAPSAVAPKAELTVAARRGNVEVELATCRVLCRWNTCFFCFPPAWRGGRWRLTLTSLQPSRIITFIWWRRT